ncbi:hypothetical protein Cni_G19394 [Canna indica]|uniref:Uncharacterized protein n=1 Tax=Canna indica TaxID=4628 RepID=A0AAQ3QJP5_9LILI|nr:hypothetical protein Cni_G19394 [Canna indica]
MGCFLACFKRPKDRRRRRSPKKSLPLLHQAHKICKPLQPCPSPKQITPNPCTPHLSPVAEVAGAVLELKENAEQESQRGTRKKVTFDLNVKTYERIPNDEDPNCSSEDEERAEEIYEERKLDERRDESSSMLRAFPLNNRYQNCESSDDDCGSDGGEVEEDDDEYDSDFDEDEEGEAGIEGNEEESYDSFFSLPIDKEPRRFQEVNSPKPKRFSGESYDSPAIDRQPIVVAAGGTRDRSQFVHPVLNPVENLSQWKEVKVRAAPTKNPKRENICTDQENKMTFIAEPAVMVKKMPEAPICLTKQEVSVDASLSNWLPPSSDNSTVDGPQVSTPNRSGSPFSREDRPILGALTIEDIKQSSVTSSPRRSPSKSPPADEIPIMGTVGRYWNSKTLQDDSASSRRSGSEIKGIPNTTSKYREDKAVNWHSTPFVVRLERALEHGTA